MDANNVIPKAHSLERGDALSASLQVMLSEKLSQVFATEDAHAHDGLGLAPAPNEAPCERVQPSTPAALTSTPVAPTSTPGGGAVAVAAVEVSSPGKLDAHQQLEGLGRAFARKLEQSSAVAEHTSLVDIAAVIEAAYREPSPMIADAAPTARWPAPSPPPPKPLHVPLPRWQDAPSTSLHPGRRPLGALSSLPAVVPLPAALPSNPSALQTPADKCDHDIDDALNHLSDQAFERLQQQQLYVRAGGRKRPGLEDLSASEGYAGHGACGHDSQRSSRTEDAQDRLWAAVAEDRESAPCEVDEDRYEDVSEDEADDEAEDRALYQKLIEAGAGRTDLSG